jgi:hypothetical protein
VSPDPSANETKETPEKQCVAPAHATTEGRAAVVDLSSRRAQPLEWESSEDDRSADTDEAGHAFQ